MAKCISFSLFGYGRDKNENCFPFQSYLLGLSHNIKMRDLLMPEWEIYVVVDEETYNSQYNAYFNYIVENCQATVEVVPMSELCMMMLQRMRPCFIERFDRVICRDTDSLLSYREAQAVSYWESTGRVAHAITDSISHTLTFLGGMCGFQCAEFRAMTRTNSFEEMVSLGRNIDYKQKGSDQTFLNQYILPRVHTSLTEHLILGMPHSFRDDCHKEIQDIELPGIPIEYKESNLLIEHIGQSGVIVVPLLKFLDKYQSREQKEKYDVIENQFTDVFYWRKWQ